jgi:hypothetical protein
MQDSKGPVCYFCDKKSNPKIFILIFINSDFSGGAAPLLPVAMFCSHHCCTLSYRDENQGDQKSEPKLVPIMTLDGTAAGPGLLV